MARKRKTGKSVIRFADGKYHIEDFGENESPRFYLVCDNEVVSKSNNPIDLESKYMDKIYGKAACKEIKKFQKEESQ